MICEYDWTIEWYSTMSKACLNCPYNITDCLNEDCITGNGVVRAVISVNRMIDLAEHIAKTSNLN